MAEGGNIKRALSYDESAVAPSFRRGMFLGGSTPARGVSTVSHPALSSTHMQHDILTPRQPMPNPSISSSGVGRGASAVRPSTLAPAHTHTDAFFPHATQT